MAVERLQCWKCIRSACASLLMQLQHIPTLFCIKALILFSVWCGKRFSPTACLCKSAVCCWPRTIQCYHTAVMTSGMLGKARMLGEKVGETSWWSGKRHMYIVWGMLWHVFRPEVWSLLYDVSTLGQTNGYMYSTSYQSQINGDWMADKKLHKNVFIRCETWNICYSGQGKLGISFLNLSENLACFLYVWCDVTRQTSAALQLTATWHVTGVFWHLL